MNPFSQFAQQMYQANAEVGAGEWVVELERTPSHASMLLEGT